MGRKAPFFMRFVQELDTWGGMQTVLVVEDEPVTRQRLVVALERSGFGVVEAESAEGARRILARSKPIVVLLDLGLPGENGLELARELGGDPDIGVIIVTQRTDSAARIEGLGLGADDYVCKPFEQDELMLRIRNLRQRVAAARKTGGGTRIRFDGWTMDMDGRTLSHPENGPVSLTRNEFDVLSALARNQGKVMSRDRILDVTGGADRVSFDRAVDSTIKRLRKKIERNPSAPDLVKTVHGVGYVFAAQVDID